MSTYTPIATQTLSSSAASVTFDGIPQTYTDLVLVASAQRNVTGSGGSGSVTINGNSTSIYSSTSLYNDGNTVYAFGWSNQTNLVGVFSAGDGSYAVNTLHFQNYSNATTHKTVITRFGFPGANSRVAANVGLWRSTDAITSITLTATSDFASGSTFTLYGIGSGSPKAFGGDEVRTDGTYWYHIYRSSGIFAPVQDLSCDYLVVAGGGSGGFAIAGGGGGGAGGFRTSIGGSPLSVFSGSNITVTVGAGGTAATTADINGSNGTDSTFSTITAIGGGKGGYYKNVGSSGGSGGGGGGRANTVGGAGTTGQGNNGGNTQTSDTNATAAGGGGGGANAVGNNAVGNSYAGNGGSGITSSIIGSSVTYAGGGGGGAYSGYSTAIAGTGGSGGGGNGGTQNNMGNPSSTATNATSGTANTGGGGGGGGREGTLPAAAAGNGGSGIVVVRYAV